MQTQATAITITKALFDKMLIQSNLQTHISVKQIEIRILEVIWLLQTIQDIHYLLFCNQTYTRGVHLEWQLTRQVVYHMAGRGLYRIPSFRFTLAYTHFICFDAIYKLKKTWYLRCVYKFNTIWRHYTVKRKHLKHTHTRRLNKMTIYLTMTIGS